MSTKVLTKLEDQGCVGVCPLEGQPVRRVLVSCAESSCFCRTQIEAECFSRLIHDGTPKGLKHISHSAERSKMVCFCILSPRLIGGLTCSRALVWRIHYRDGIP